MGYWRRVGLGAALLVVGVTAATGLYILTFQPDRHRYPVRGIDISHHQGVIDWQAVAADDVAFAYVKVSEGGDHRDTRYRANIAGATAAGIATGAYHYFTFCRSGAEQAQNFLAAIEGENLTLPPVIDLEFEGNCERRPSRDEMAREVGAFVDAVEARLGRQVVYYATEWFRLSYGSGLPTRPLWCRLIAFEPFHVNWRIWQYDDDAKVAGIDAPVDVNLIAGDLAGLISLD